MLSSNVIKGRVIDLELVSEGDARFILDLRNNKDLSTFISPTTITLDKQRAWIKSYKKREAQQQEFYFIVKNKENIPCGTVRIYDIDSQQKSCEFGSFILHPCRPEKSSYEVFKLLSKFALVSLELKKMTLKVFEGNSKAVYLYNKVGFELLEKIENELFFRLELNSETL